jgi:hypothetical protein
LLSGADRPQLVEEDIAAIERLMPHIARSPQLRRAFFRAEATAQGLQAVADRLPAGLALLDAEGTALFVNRAMQAIAQRGDGFTLDRAGRPSPVSQPARKRFDRLLRDVGCGGDGGTLTLRRTKGGNDYVVLIAPMRSPQTDMARTLRAHRGTTIVVHDPSVSPATASEILEKGLHLPKGAARLVAALATDDDLKSFAERKGVTIHTARFHLRTAMAGTGARTQAELVRLAVRLLRDAALAEPSSQGF